jgi:hypothetical protein
MPALVTKPEKPGCLSLRETLCYGSMGTISGDFLRESVSPGIFAKTH